MTLTYPDGTVLDAVVISHDDHEIRAVTPGGDDVLAFTRIHGSWVSEDGEPVTIVFEWQRRRVRPSYSEDDYACSKELAARLIGAMFWGDEVDKAIENTAFVVQAQDPWLTS